MSRRLANRSIDHVVLERGEVADSWRTQRWDPLRLLTPNWMTRLPGYAYRGDDPDGYLTASETAQLIADYAKEIAAPVRANTTVISVRPADGQGKPQGVGKRWRGWYVGDDGKPLTRRFRTEVEAEAWAQQATRQGSHKPMGPMGRPDRGSRHLRQCRRAMDAHQGAPQAEDVRRVPVHPRHPGAPRRALYSQPVG